MNTRIFSLFLVLAACFVTLSADESKPNLKWHTDYSTALKESQSSHKPIMLLFTGSDWCKFCKRLMQNVLKTDTFAKFAEESLILVYVDFPRKEENALSEKQLKHNEDLDEKYNLKESYPFITFLNSKEEILGSLSGYRGETPEEYIEKIKEQLQAKKEDQTKQNQAKEDKKDEAKKE